MAAPHDAQHDAASVEAARMGPTAGVSPQGVAAAASAAPIRTADGPTEADGAANAQALALARQRADACAEALLQAARQARPPRRVPPVPWGLREPALMALPPGQRQPLLRAATRRLWRTPAYWTWLGATAAVCSVAWWAVQLGPLRDWSSGAQLMLWMALALVNALWGARWPERVALRQVLAEARQTPRSWGPAKG